MAYRRTFLKGSLLTAIAAGAFQAQAKQGEPSLNQWVSIIDLDACDGCADRAVPLCVKACRDKNQKRFPQPQKPLRPYWPQKTFEDFSERQDLISRLTPYNWLYVEKVELEDGKVVYAPRRCMHCFDAPCRKICPFGAINRTDEGAVQIDSSVCFGGAKCRDVCPWSIPQRQAGVGLYLDVAPKFAGGGVMYKCDFCADSLDKGGVPVCATACPQKATVFLPLTQAIAHLRQIVGKRYVYGLNENGGTATWYVSSVSFEAIETAHLKTKQSVANDGRPGFAPVASKLQESSDWALATLAAPAAALAVAYVVARRKKVRHQNHKDEA